MKLIQPHLEMIIRNQADKKYPHRLTLRLANETVPQYNFRCHWVAAQAAKSRIKGAVGVVETVIIYTNGITGHYVNLMEDGTMCDFTLGLANASEDVRLIRHVHPDEFDNMDNVLRNLKKKLCEGIPAYYSMFYNPQDLC